MESHEKIDLGYPEAKLDDIEKLLQHKGFPIGVEERGKDLAEYNVILGDTTLRMS